MSPSTVFFLIKMSGRPSANIHGYLITPPGPLQCKHCLAKKNEPLHFQYFVVTPHPGRSCCGGAQILVHVMVWLTAPLCSWVSQLAWQYVTYCVTWPSAGPHILLHVFMPRPLQAYLHFVHDTCFALLDILGQGLSVSALCCYPPTLTF